MEIRHKLYPYPVLSHYTDDYEHSSFDNDIKIDKEGYNIKFHFTTEVVDDVLLDMLNNDKVSIVYHLECAQTGYRVAILTKSFETVHLVPEKKLCGRLQICPFIIAITDLQNYVNDSFHSDYRGFKFTIESGCVMAVGRQVNVDIDKDISELSNTPSVFRIIKNADATEQGMLVDMNTQKIIIKVPEQEFYNYKSLEHAINVQPVLNSLVVIPALIYVLEEVSKREASERYEYSSYSWYRAVRKALLTKFNCDIDSEEFSEANIIELAQKLINVPLTDSLIVLSSGYGTTYEEEDES